MPVRVATVRDPQSAEYLKSLALGDRTGRSPAEGLVLWRAARSLAPENATIVAHLALALFDQRRYAEVVELLAPALVRWPRHPHLVNVLGVSLYQLGHAADAERLFEYCLSLDPDYPSAEESLANARRERPRSRPVAPEVSKSIGEALSAGAALPRPTLAVCMIVKNEAGFIEDALASVRAVADEMIVVDTGSTDETVALAEAAGARVGFFAWIGDFAAARNASLEAAKSEWILVLDADERLAPRSRTALRAIMEEYRDRELRVVCPRILNHTRDGRFQNEGFSGRLFRRDPRLRFEGRVHEEVGRNVPGISTDYRLDLELIHYGYSPEVMREKGKDDRNIQLLLGRLEEDRDDLLTWYYLASQHWTAQRMDEAGEAFERVIELFERDPSHYGMAVLHMPVPYSYVGRVRTHLDVGRPSAALTVGERGLRRFPDNPDLWFHTAFAQIRLGALDEARRFLERALSAQVAGYALIGMHDKAIKAWRAPKALADIDFEQRRAAEAYAGYRAVVDRMPEGHPDIVVVRARLVELASELNDLEALDGLTRTYIRLRPTQIQVAEQAAAQLVAGGQNQAAYELLAGLYDEFEALRERLSLCHIIGRIAVQAGDDQEALLWYERAMNIGTRDPRFWLELAQLLLRTGQEQPAREAYGLARQLLAEAKG